MTEPFLDEDKLKEHVKDKDTWLRFVYMLVLGFAFYVAVLLTLFVALFQFLAKLFSGSFFPGVAAFGANLAAYLSQTTLYLSFASDERPFPFAPFPVKEKTAVEPSEETPA